MMKTGSSNQRFAHTIVLSWSRSIGLKRGEGGGAHIPSSSLTDSPMVTDVSWFEYWSTKILVSSIPSL